MKKLFYILLLLGSTYVFAQNKGMTYQAVIYAPGGQNVPGVNVANVPMTNRTICLQFSLLDASSGLEYQEVVKTKTDEFGMVNITIGSGTQTGGYATSFGAVVWSASADKSMKVALDATGLCNQYEELSVEKLDAVPFANAAITAGNVTGVVALTNGGTGATTAAGARTNLGIGNVDNTSDLNKPMSTATKTYVDSQLTNSTIVDADANTKGKVQLAGDLAGTAAAPTVPGLALKENAANKSTTTTLGTSNVLFPTQNAVKTYVDTAIAGATIVDADANTKGKIQLAGDLAGTAAAPTVPGLALKLDASLAGVPNGIATLNSAGIIPANQLPPISVASTNVVGSQAAMLALSNATVGSIAVRTDLNKNFILSTAGPSVLANWIELLTPGAPVQSVNGLTGAIQLSKADINLANVDNTSDAAKPISTATQNALNLKLNTNQVGVPNGTASLNALGKIPTDQIPAISFSSVKVLASQAEMLAQTNALIGSVVIRTDVNKNYVLAQSDPTILANWVELLTPAPPVQSVNGYVGNVSLTKADLGLGNVDNTGDINKPVSTPTQNALDLKANLASPSFTGTVTGITKSMVGLANVDNTTDLNKPVSTATQTALDLKANTVDLTAETTRATAAEATLTTNVATNATAIAAETTRATAAESTLTTNVATNATAIAAETTRATAAETTLTTNLAAEVTRATAAEALKANATDVTTSLALKANLASPTFTGTPTAPTPATADNSTTIATTEYVKNSIVAANAGLSTIGNISATSNAKGAVINGTTELVLTPADDTNGGVVTTGAQTFAGAKTFGTDITVNGIKIGKGGGNKLANTAIGSGALALNTSGNGSTAFGYNALSKSTDGYATAFGTAALENLTTGTANVAIGYTALNQTSSQNYNTAVGDQAMRNSTGANNTVLGASALSGVAGQTTGNNNTAIGTFVLRNATTAAFNVGVGSNSLNNLTTGNDNTVLGYRSGYYAGSGTSTNLTSMTQGVLIGSNVRTGTNTSTNEIAIGYNVVGNGSNTVTIGNSSVTGNYFNGNITTTGQLTSTVATGTAPLVVTSTTPVVNLNIAGNATNVTGTVAIANGGTGATTAAAALTNLGAEPTANKSTATDLGNTAPSDQLFPSQKAVKAYVDAQTAAAGVSDGSITSAKIADGTIVNADVSTTAAIAYSKLNLASSIVVGDLAADAVETVKIKDANVTTAKLADDAVETAKIKNLNVTTDKLATDAVTSAKITDGTIVVGDLADNAVETAKIKAAAVTNAKLDKANIPLSGFGAAAADVALGANKLTGVADPTLAQDAATKNYVDTATAGITTLADGKIYLGNASNVATEVTPSGDVTITNAGVTAIGTGKVVVGMLATDAVETIKIKDANVTEAKLAADAVTSAKITDGTIVVGDLADNAVETAKIKAAAVTNAKLDKANIPLSGFGAAAADVVLGANKLTGVADPTLAQDAATKNYVDTATAGITTLADGKIYLGNASNVATEVTPSGDVTMTNAGVTAIGTGKVVVGMLATDAVETIKIKDANVTAAKLAADAVETAKIKDANVTYAKIQNVATGKVLGRVSANAGVVEEIATTGTGDVVRATSPTLVTPTLGAATATTINKVTITQPTTSATLTIAEGKTLTANNSIVLAGTDDKTMTFPTTDATIARTDAAQTFTGVQTFSSDMVVNSVNIGRGKGSVATNTAVGKDAISATATGADNTALGYNTLKAITSGSGNTAVGSQAALAMTTGINNTVFGNSALSTVTSSQSNTAIGNDALKLLGDSTNDRNTAVGTGSFANLTSGQYNVGVGMGSLLNAGSGSNNVAVGKYAGFRDTNNNGVSSSNQSVFIGSETKPLNSTSTNEIVIGYDARGLGNNSTVLGNSLITQAKVFGALDLPDATTSTSTTTGALKVGGGVGIVENLNVGGNAKITGTLTVTNGAGAGKVLTSDAIGLGTWTTPTGVTTMAAIGSTPNANGATISGVNLNLEPASASYGGIVTTGTQTFAGAKTFSPAVTAASALATGTKFTPTLTAAADADILVGLDINPTFSNGSYAGLTNYALRVQGIGFGRGGGAVETNTAIGSGVLIRNSTGANNTGLGYRALLSNTTGSGNTAFGSFAGAYIAATGSGGNASGTNSTFIGYNTSPLTDGDDNEVVIAGGNATTRTVGLGSNTTLIGNAATTQTRIMGALDLPNATSSTTTTTGALKVAGGVGIVENLNVGGNTKINGTLTVTNGAGAGKVLTSDANGLGTWTTSNAVPYTGATGAVNLGSYDMRVNGLTVGVGNNGRSVTYFNTSLGSSALSGNNSGVGANTAIGSSALAANTSGAYNTGIGFYSLQANTLGSDNTAIGYFALRNNNSTTSSEASYNSAFGSNALENNTTGYRNSAFGYGAIRSNTTGNYNSGFGFGALSSVSSASFNTAVGVSAGSAITTGDYNIFIGSDAGKYVSSAGSLNSTGNKSVLIGYDVRPNGNAETNQIVISGYNGSGTVGLGSNSTLIGNSSTTSAKIFGALTLPNSTSSSSTSTGALVVGGGVGIAKELNVGATTASTSATTGALTIAGGAGIAGALNVGTTATITGATTISSTTTSTSTTTGALKVAGGAGIAENLNVGGNAKISGTVEIDGGSPGVGKVLVSDANGVASWSSNSNGGASLITATATMAATATYNLIVFSGSTASQTITLPSATDAGAGREITIKNIASVPVTINATAGNLISDSTTTGATSLSIGIEPSNNWIKAISTGSNWIILRALF